MGLNLGKSMKRCLATFAICIVSMFSQAQSVVIETSMGDIHAKLLAEESPITVKNFLSYVDSGFYNGVIFHRVIEDFMIQTGGFDQNMTRKKTLPPIVNESNNYVQNKRGTIAMARTGDPNSATSQFFINQKHNRSLNYMFGKPGYAVFGNVTKGLAVLDAIAAAETAPKGGQQDMPVKPIVIKTIRRATEADLAEVVAPE